MGYNFTIFLGQDTSASSKSGWGNVNVNCTTNTYGDDEITAKVTFNNSDFDSNGFNIHDGKTFSEMENEMTAENSIFRSDDFPVGTYGINCSGVSSNATTFNLTGNQTARLACAVYLQGMGNYVEVIVDVNDASFKNALLCYQIPFKLTLIDN